MRSAALLGAHLRFACPSGYSADVAELERLGAARRGGVTQTHRPAEAVAGADAVHADTWVSMGQEDEKAARASRRSRASPSTAT